MLNKNDKQDLSSRTVSGLKWASALKIFSQIFRFIIGIFLARILDPIDFGIMAIGHMVIHYTNSLSDFGFINAIVQKKELNQKHIDSVFTLNLSISIFLFMLVAFFSNTIGKFFNSPESSNVILAMSLLFVIRTFRDIYLALLRRDVLFKKISKIFLIENISNSIIAITLALLGMRYWSLVFSSLISTILISSILFIHIENKPRLAYSHSAMKSIYHFGIYNFFRSQFFFINQFVSQALVGKFFGPVSLGYYEKSYQLANIPRESIATQINSVMFSSFSRLQSDKEGLKKWFIKIVKIETVLLLPVLIGLASVSEHFITIVLGEKWIPSIVPLKILSIGMVFQIVNGLIVSLNIGSGRYKQQTYVEIPGTILFVLLAILFSKWGVEGIALCYTLVMCTNTLLSFMVLKRGINIKFGEIFTQVAPYALNSLIMLAVVRYTYTAYLAEYTVGNMVCLIVTGATCYVLTTLTVNKILNKNVMYPLKE